MHSHDSHALGPALRRAQATLRSALDEVCHTDIGHANTGELIRVEEVLAIANEAAKEAVSVRRRLSTERTAAGSPASADAPASREIEDENGVRWSVFEVHPTTTADRPSVRERFRDGWLSFDSGLETRRLVPIPADWQTASGERLLELLNIAERATRRSGGRSAPATPPASSPLEGRG